MGNLLSLRDLSDYEESVSIYNRNDNDKADRLSYLYTTFILFWLAVAVTCKQYVGEPIQCWTPQHFTKHHDAYTNDICWTRSTYFLPLNESIPSVDSPEASNKHTIVYYQWIPVVLLIQSFIFCLPRLFWTTFADHSGVEVGNFVDNGAILTTLQMENTIREKITKQMCLQVDRYLWSSASPAGHSKKSVTFSINHLLSRTCFRMCGYRYANYLITIYIITKILYVVNVIGQLLAMNVFLGTGTRSYAIDLLSALISGDDWAASKQFPRVTMCDLNVRRLGNLHRYTVQCVLPINLFNEKIFVFLWFWFVMVASVTCISTVAWILRSVRRNERFRYVSRYLVAAGKITTQKEGLHRRKLTMFMDEYLRQDGVFLIRLLSGATNGLTAMEVTAELWENYFSKPEIRVKMRQPPVAGVNNNNQNGRRRPLLSSNSNDRSGLPDYHSLDLEPEKTKYEAHE